MNILKLLSVLIFTSQAIFAQVSPVEEIFIPEGTYPKEEFVKVAVIQWAPAEAAPLSPKEAVEEHKKRQREKLEEFIREAAAQNAEYIVTPEFATIGYPDIPELPLEDDNFRSRKDIELYVEKVNGPTAKHFSKIAKDLNVWIQIGYPEVEVKTEKYFNSVVVFNNMGETVAHYRKQSLFKIESNYLSKGTRNITFNSPMGKTGLAICSDIYASYVMAPYATEKLDVFSISTSWANYNSGWGYYVSAATQLNAYTMASNHNYFPDSGVINPDGTNQSHIRQTTGIAYGFIPRVKSEE